MTCDHAHALTNPDVRRHRRASIGIRRGDSSLRLYLLPRIVGPKRDTRRCASRSICDIRRGFLVSSAKTCRRPSGCCRRAGCRRILDRRGDSIKAEIAGLLRDRLASSEPFHRISRPKIQGLNDNGGQPSTAFAMPRRSAVDQVVPFVQRPIEINQSFVRQSCPKHRGSQVAPFPKRVWSGDALSNSLEALTPPPRSRGLCSGHGFPIRTGRREHTSRTFRPASSTGGLSDFFASKASSAVGSMDSRESRFAGQSASDGADHCSGDSSPDRSGHCAASPLLRPHTPVTAAPIPVPTG